jgi:pimeloyl-ACP methyl ester carboxylesterase
VWFGTLRSVCRKELMKPLLCSLIMTGALAAAATAASAIELTPCRLKGVEREVRCGAIERPENADAPDGRHIAIHFAVVPALAKNEARDPVFVFAGGPGQSAIQSAGVILPVFAQLNARRDIVFIDQRGTGKSNGLLCDTPPATAPIAAHLDMAAFAARIGQCLKTIKAENKADLAQYATWIATRDVDAVRGALGYKRINLWGGSYGSRAALDYLRQFPETVRTVVIDGVAPADMALPVSLAIDADTMLRKLADRCAAEAACKASFPDFSTDVDTLLARAETAAPEVTLTHPLTGAREVVTVDRRLIAAALRAPLYAPQLSAVLPHAVASAATDDYNPLLALAGSLAGNVAENFAEGMHYAVICAEDMPRIDEAARARARGTRFGLSFTQVYDDVCRQVDVRPAPPAFYSIASVDVPVLVLSGGMDPATPPRHGESVAAHLKKSLHLVAPHLGHGVSSQGCTPELITKFVRQATFDGLDGGCLAKMPAPPFFRMPRGGQP